jgi:hypothetical protein
MKQRIEPASAITCPAGIRTFNLKFKQNKLEQLSVVDNLRIVSGPAPQLFRLFLAGSVYGVTFNGHCFSEI